MSERLPTQNPNVEKSPESPYSEIINSSVENLQDKYGLDLEQALKVGEREFSAEDVKEQAGEITNTLKLDKEFFEDDSRTMFLMMTAESFCAMDETPKEKQKAESQMLLDFLLLSGAAKYSDEARTHANDNLRFKDQYVDRYIETPPTSLEKEQDEFLNSIEDKNVSAEITKILNESDILDESRKLFGVTSETENPFKIQVVNLDVDGEASDIAKNNAKEYDKLFLERSGHFIPNFEERTRTLRLPIEVADMIIGIANGTIDRYNLEDDKIQDQLDAVLHEYAHTQKDLSHGGQRIGVISEELKAIRGVPRKVRSYQDVNSLFDAITKSDIIEPDDFNNGFSASLKSDNPSAAFNVFLSNRLGLRATLLMNAAVPTPYEKKRYSSKNFIDLSHLKTSQDMPSLQLVWNYIYGLFYEAETP